MLKSLIDFSNTDIRLDRPLADYSKVKELVTVALRCNRLQMMTRAVRRERYLNVGCGMFPEPGFVNLDYTWHSGVDLVWDISKGLPFAAGRFDGIYTEHCLEHIEFNSCYFVMKELHRVLRPNSVLRLVLPDSELFVRIYLARQQGGQEDFPPEQYAIPCSIYPAEMRGKYTPMMMVNRIFRDYGHCFAYDYETVEVMLTSVGFTQITRREFGVGREEDLLKDRPERKDESFYVEAVKLA